jgi:hypothetical protein
MTEKLTSVDPFTAMAQSRLAADEREFKAKVISEIKDLKALVIDLVAKLEAKASKHKE